MVRSSNENGGARRSAKHWAWQAGTALASIPLLLQPFGAPSALASANSGGGETAALYLVKKHSQQTFEVKLNSIFPNITSFASVVSDNTNVAEGVIPTSSGLLQITSKGLGKATFTVTPLNGSDLTPKKIAVTMIDPGPDNKIDISDIRKLVTASPSTAQSPADMANLLNGIEVRSVNGRPIVQDGGIAGRTVTANETDFIYAAEFSKYFSDPEEEELTYSVRSGSETIVTAFLSDGGIVIEGHQAGTAVLYIKGTDPAGGTAELAVPVTVLPSVTPPVNHAPEKVKGITRYVIDEQEPLRISMDALFRDQDGDQLSYTYTRSVGSPESVTSSVYSIEPSEGELPDWGATVVREGNTLLVNEAGENFDSATFIQISATDAAHPNSPVSQTVAIYPKWMYYSEILADRMVFTNSRMEIDLHQKFNYSTVAGATYHYYLQNLNQTVTTGTYSNAHIEGNKLIIEGTLDSQYGEMWREESYRVIGLFEDQEQTSEIIDSFKLGVEGLPYTGSQLDLWRHLEHMEGRWEEIGDYTVTGRFFETVENPISGSTFQLGWTYGTEGEVAIQAYPRVFGETTEYNPSTPVVTYKIRFLPHIPSS
ncbi:hypothetical protein [Paenibacillus rigui]|uniref:Uncharacterized protein n=1 Tax=Paenibacillus rigui TaxID=554312 RepID=A0A229UJA4_9BACL|nr:hypothetical protein [Paenibacillus rigui]OXM83538.1 hypothetical protein CF651_24815 [Paenibacillus rigui]